MDLARKKTRPNSSIIWIIKKKTKKGNKFTYQQHFYRTKNKIPRKKCKLRGAPISLKSY